MVKSILLISLALKSLSQYLWNPPDIITRGPELIIKPLNELPDSLFWGNINGKNYLTVSRNQHIPEYCGACWAFATASTLSDRFKILRNAEWPDINISQQVLLSCDMVDRGCFGGRPLNAYEYIFNNGITDETCLAYQARGHSNGLGCEELGPCYTCDYDGSCYVPDSYFLYNVTGYQRIVGVEQMVNAL